MKKSLGLGVFPVVAFVFSLILHGGLAGIIYFISRFDSKIHSDTVVIEIKHASPPQGGSGLGSAKAVKSKTQSQKLPKLTLRDLGISSSESSYVYEKKASRLEWTHASEYSNDALNSFDGLPMEHIRFEKILWKEIDQAIEDSHELSEYNHTGVIHLKFSIDSSGRLMSENLRACGDDKVLQVLASRALRKALRNERKELKFPSTELSYFAQFSWTDRENCKALSGIKKNFFSFCHYAENKAKEFSKTEKVLTYLGSLQNGAGALEVIQQYNKEEMHRRLKFDPFENLKNDPDWNLNCY